MGRAADLLQPEQPRACRRVARVVRRPCVEPLQDLLVRLAKAPVLEHCEVPGEKVPRRVRAADALELQEERVGALTFWSKKSGKSKMFPGLRHVFAQSNAIKPTSVFSEGNFSDSGAFMDDSRKGLLKSDLLQALTFININSEHIPEPASIRVTQLDPPGRPLNGADETRAEGWARLEKSHNKRKRS